MGLNLHNIVRGAINTVHPDEQLLVVRSAGQSVDDEGNVHPEYFRVTLSAQVQTESDSALFNANMAGQNEMVRKVYLYAGSSALTQTRGIFRPLTRSGDFLRRTDGTWWKVTGVTEDYSSVGWMCVRVVLQVNPPEGWDEGDCDCD